MKYLHDHFISLREKVLAHKTRLPPPLFIEVPVPSQEREQSCIGVRGVDVSSFYDFSIAVSIFVFHFNSNEYNNKITASG